MSGFCGWIGGGARLQDARRTLERMTAGLPRHGDCRSRALAEAAHGLALCAHAAIGDRYADATRSVAIEGYPEWSNPHWAALAREEGHAHALARAYAERGAALLHDLHGPFSFAVLDHVSGGALLAIDRFGIQPLCYALAGDGGLVFGSTTDSVAAHPHVTATVSPQAIFDFFYFIDRIPAPETIYREQSKLLPGQYLRFDKGRTERKAYWRMPYSAGGEEDPEQLSRELLERLRAAVTRSLRGEDLARVAAFLSGGLDSSTVVGLLAEMCPGDARAFTIAFDLEGYDESGYAALAAQHFGADHDIYHLQPDDVVNAISGVADIYDEPFANSSAIPAYFCALRARQAGFEVMLAGDGGDELFAGNSRYLHDRVFDHYLRVPALLRHLLIEPLVAHFPGRQHIALVQRAARYIRLANRTVPERLCGNNLFAVADPSAVFAPEVLDSIDTKKPVRLVNEIYDLAGSPSKLHRMLHLDLRLTLADGDIRKVSRMCELAGVRAKYPMLDEELAEFSARIPPGLLLGNGELRHFYKRALRNFLPRETLAKPKHGFALPYPDLLRTHKPIRELACDSVASLKGRRYFRNSFLDRQLENIRQGDSKDSGTVVWDLMMLEQWFQSRSIA